MFPLRANHQQPPLSMAAGCPALPCLAIAPGGSSHHLGQPMEKRSEESTRCWKKIFGKETGQKEWQQERKHLPSLSWQEVPGPALAVGCHSDGESREQHRNFLPISVRSISKLQIAPGKSTGKKQGKSRHLHPGPSQGVSCEAPQFRQRNATSSLEILRQRRGGQLVFSTS